MTHHNKFRDRSCTLLYLIHNKWRWRTNLVHVFCFQHVDMWWLAVDLYNGCILAVTTCWTVRGTHGGEVKVLPPWFPGQIREDTGDDHTLLTVTWAPGLEPKVSSEPAVTLFCPVCCSHCLWPVLRMVYKPRPPLLRSRVLRVVVDWWRRQARPARVC